MIPLYKPFMPAELPELNYILSSGALAYGKWGVQFERSLKEFIGCSEDVIVVNSFTSAILVCLSTLDVQSGDEIIMSPQSCLASTQPLLHSGAKVVWADIDPTRGTLSPESVEQKITSKTKAIFHNHHCGYPGYIDEINEIGVRHGVVVVDDCIESFGSKYKGRYLGNLGTDVSIFSFQTVRLPNAIDGGGIIFKNKKMAEKAKLVRDLGVDRNFFRDSRGEISKDFDITVRGYGATLDEISNYIGYMQVKEIGHLLELQQKNGAGWIEKMGVNVDYSLLNTDYITPNYWVFGLLSNDKNKTIDEFKKMGFMCSGVHLPNYYYSVFETPLVELKGVTEFYNRFVAIPSGWWVK